MHKNYLFDLDGTLLPMPDTKSFVELYLQSLCKALTPVLKIQPELLVSSVWNGTHAMLSNDGTRLNHDVFWETASKTAPEPIDSAPGRVGNAVEARRVHAAADTAES